jgi:hypothetical protein
MFRTRRPWWQRFYEFVFPWARRLREERETRAELRCTCIDKEER